MILIQTCSVINKIIRFMYKQYNTLGGGWLESSMVDILRSKSSKAIGISRAPRLHNGNFIAKRLSGLGTVRSTLLRTTRPVVKYGDDPNGIFWCTDTDFLILPFFILAVQQIKSCLVRLP